MINNQSFEALKAELSRTVFAIKKQANSINLQIFEYPDFISFKRNLIGLQLEFNQEIHNNICLISSKKETELYFEMLLTSFSLLRDLICSCSEIECLAFSGQEENDPEDESTCIHYDSAELATLKNYIHFKKSIIDQSISMTSSCKQKMEESGTKSENKKNECMHVMAEFAPFLSKYREVLNNIYNPKEKIEFLNGKRKELTLLFKEKSIDLYDSSINVWFETRIEAYRETLLQEKKTCKNEEKGLKWLLTKTDFFELIISLDSMHAVGDANKNPISKKELIHVFSRFLSIKKIPDYESRITKLVSRINPTSFLDRLRDKIKILSSGK